MLIPFVGDAYKVRSPNLNCQSCINLYPAIDQKGGKTGSILYRTPGLTLFADDTVHFTVRGLMESNGVLYAVIDNIFYWVDILGVKRSLGELLSSVGPIQMESNGFQIMIVEDTEGGKNYYVYTILTKEFKKNPSEFFAGAQTATYQDGYGILPKPNSTDWYITDLFDFALIDPLDFGVADTSEDYLVTAISRSQEVWLLKSNSAEVWYNTGDELFTFERRQTLIFRYGCAAAYSLVRVDNTLLIYLARNDHSEIVVVTVNGYEASIISDEGVNFAIQSYEVIDDAIAFVYENQGHVFYVLTFPTADRTWVYDLNTQMWHERRSQIDNKQPSVLPTRQGRWRPNCYAFFNKKHVVGDFESGKLYVLDNDNFTDNGIPIRWERTAYHLSKDEKFLFINCLQLIAQGGVGLNNGQGSNPQVMLQISKNLGHTFGAERWKSLGKQGKFNYRTKWNALGSARDTVYRISGTDPNIVAILGIRADVEEAVH